MSDYASYVKTNLFLTGESSVQRHFSFTTFTFILHFCNAL